MPFMFLPCRSSDDGNCPASILLGGIQPQSGGGAFFATVTSTLALPGDIEGVANDVAFTELSTQRTIGVETGTREVLALLHKCLMTEKAAGIQAESFIPGLQKTINNTSLKKHR